MTKFSSSAHDRDRKCMEMADSPMIDAVDDFKYANGVGVVFGLCGGYPISHSPC